jgi:hypothetical protein
MRRKTASKRGEIQQNVQISETEVPYPNTWKENAEKESEAKDFKRFIKSADKTISPKRRKIESFAAIELNGSMKNQNFLPDNINNETVFRDKFRKGIHQKASSEAPNSDHQLVPTKRTDFLCPVFRAAPDPKDILTCFTKVPDSAIVWFISSREPDLAWHRNP